MTKKALLVLVLIGGFLSLIWLANSQPNPSPTPSMPSKEDASAKLATLERGWVKNEGQWDEEALFSAPGYFGTTWITKDGQLVHTAVKGKESWVISERWVGGKVKAIMPEEELHTKVSYFVGNDPSKHKSGLPTYRYVSLGEVWSGVEVKLKATQRTVEKLFYVKPGVDPSKIVVEVNGAEGLKLSKDGEIIIQTGLGELKLSKPIAWQEKDGKKLPVEVSYKLIGKNRYSFDVAKADPSLPIVIDPILQSTYLGGRGNDIAKAIAIHPKTGDVYVAGETLSTNFPKTTRGAQARKSGFSDIFVTRLNKELTQILQSTYLGGSNWDEANALAVHPITGEIYVAGRTESRDFPRTTGGAQATHGGGSYDAFVARLNPDLTQNLQSTYLGGSDNDVAKALAIHPTTGDVYVAGFTNSTNFPKTTGGAQTICNNCFSSGMIPRHDAFVARLNSNLTQNLQSTYLGGSNNDVAEALVIHPATGEVYVAGRTESRDFPNTAGGARRSPGGFYDAFVARLNLSLTQILQSTYLGGSELDEATALAVHPTTGDIYVAGMTRSTDFPKTTSGAQASYKSESDAFVARFNKDLTKLLRATYLGGGGLDKAEALALHPATGEVYVAGNTNSTDFPNTAGGAQANYGGGQMDAFVAKLNPDLTQILQSTYLGGSALDESTALAIHPTTGDVYVVGWTYSTDFPNTTGGAQASFGGDLSDAFVTKLSADLTSNFQSTYPGRTNNDWGSDLAIHPKTGDVYVAGCTYSTDFPNTAGGAQESCNSCGNILPLYDTYIALLTVDLVADKKSSGGGGSHMTGSVSSLTDAWSILLLLSIPAFVLARRIGRR
jgi:hypothetical protein